MTDSSGKTLLSNDAVINGCKITLNAYGDTAYVIIKGDADSNGRLSAADYMRIRRCFTNAFTLTGVNLEAADVDGDGIISTSDYLAIKAHFKYGIIINSSFTNANLEN